MLTYLRTSRPHCVKRTQKEFRLELAREMMGPALLQKRKDRVSADSMPPSVWFCEWHFPDMLQKRSPQLPILIYLCVKETNKSIAANNVMKVIPSLSV